METEAVFFQHYHALRGSNGAYSLPMLRLCAPTLPTALPFPSPSSLPPSTPAPQMGKQTMGIPFYSPYRFDNKVYKLQTPQWPISRTRSAGAPLQCHVSAVTFPAPSASLTSSDSWHGWPFMQRLILLLAGMVYETMPTLVLTSRRGPQCRYKILSAALCQGVSENEEGLATTPIMHDVRVVTEHSAASGCGIVSLRASPLPAPSCLAFRPRYKSRGGKGRKAGERKRGGETALRALKLDLLGPRSS